MTDKKVTLTLQDGTSIELDVLKGTLGQDVVDEIGRASCRERV